MLLGQRGKILGILFQLRIQLVCLGFGLFLRVSAAVGIRSDQDMTGLPGLLDLEALQVFIVGLAHFGCCGLHLRQQAVRAQRHEFNAHLLRHPELILMAVVVLFRGVGIEFDLWHKTVGAQHKMADFALLV